MTGITFLILALAALGPVADTTDVLVVTIDDRAVEGTIDLPDITIETIFGETLVKTSELRSVTFGKTDVVVTSEGTILRGHVVMQKLDVTVKGEVVTLERKDLVSLTVTGAKEMPASIRGLR